MSSGASSPASTPSGVPRVLLQTGNARSSSSGGPTRRQRVLWDSDNATRGGKTSIAVLLDWLTAPGNYARWRDGKTQTGETREALCSEIKITMRQHGIHHRENANIRTQISELERSFDAARNWLKENNYDPYTFRRAADEHGEDIGAIVIEGPHGPAEAHVLRMCRYYHTLNDVFGLDEDKGLRQRRSYQRTVTYPVPIRKRKLPGEEEESQDVEPKTFAVETMEEQRLVLDNIMGPATTVSANASAASAATSTPRSSAVPIAPTAAISTAGLAGTWANPAALESTQRMLAEAVREERERKRFCMEEERNKLECEKLRYEVEAAKLNLTIDRALARKKLLDAGLPEAQVNELFPK